jgi:hypothetical protein
MSMALAEKMACSLLQFMKTGEPNGDDCRVAKIHLNLMENKMLEMSAR